MCSIYLKYCLIYICEKSFLHKFFCKKRYCLKRLIKSSKFKINYWKTFFSDS